MIVDLYVEGRAPARDRRGSRRCCSRLRARDAVRRRAARGTRLVTLQRPVRRRPPGEPAEDRLLPRGLGGAGLLARSTWTTAALLRGEFFTLLLFSLLGMMVMICASSFLTLYLGLELMSLCLYALVALNRDSARVDRGGDEVLRARRAVLGPAALRHVDDLRRDRLAELTRGRAQAMRLAASSADRDLLVFGLVFVVAGLAFKLGVVPFHMWIPDVYHGAPTPVTLIIGSGAEARRLRDGDPPAGERAAGPRAPTGSRCSRCSRALDGDRQHHRDRADRTSSACSPTRRSRTWASCCSACSRASRRQLVQPPDAYSAALFYMIIYALMTLGAFGMLLSSRAPASSARTSTTSRA